MGKGPSWEQLYETAAAQAGLFSSAQAAEAGYSRPLLQHHVHSGRVLRLRRGVYRLVHFPAGEHEELVELWLWTERAGVASHQTALALHGLSDALPALLHFTLPPDWKKRRLRVPEGLQLHHSEVTAKERTWVGPVPVTSVARTLNDCARSDFSPELLGQGARQAIRRGLVQQRQLGPVITALEPFGGIPE
jgi:predicted transcriptional regulator of viral defense system